MNEIPETLVPLFEGGRMPPQRPSFFYQLGLGLVALMMVLLPLIYCAIAALAGYGVYFFATHYFGQIWDWPMRGRYGLLIKFVCSFTPLLVGGLIALFMVKPIFARQPKKMQPITLNPEHEPLFHQLVHRICAIVGSPAPREVRLDCAVNASAGFRRGFLSFFGDDLVLTVGMPLVAGLTTQELAGVIAHEFGHFRQAVAMRLSYIVRRVNHWFARVIYERDSWDEALVSWSQTDTMWINFMVGCARFGVWLSRLILTGLNYLGHSISSFLMRQMEFDADRCEVHVAGSAAFESTVFRLNELGATTQRLYRDMQRDWNSNYRVPDNVPLLIAHHTAALNDDQRAKLAAQCVVEKTSWLDSHPSNADRVAAARRAAHPGLFTDEMPATSLLENFSNLARMVTLAHYEDDLEIPTTDDFLIPVEAILNPSASAPEVEMQPTIRQAPRWQGIPSKPVGE